MFQICFHDRKRVQVPEFLIHYFGSIGSYFLHSGGEILGYITVWTSIIKVRISNGAGCVKLCFDILNLN